MEIYPRRDQAILDCVSPYVYDIINYSEDSCDPTGDPDAVPPIAAGPCTWVGKFAPVMYNVVTPTFSWVVKNGPGSIVGSNTEESVEVHVTSSAAELFDLEVTIDSISDGATTTSVFVKEFTTSLS